MAIRPYFRFAEPADGSTISKTAETHVVAVLVGIEAPSGDLEIVERTHRGETSLGATQRGNAVHYLAWRPTSPGTIQLSVRSRGGLAPETTILVQAV